VRSVNTIEADVVERPARHAAALGVAAMAPLTVAYAPFALVIGAAVAQVDDPVAGWAGSWLIFGGSAHLAALRGLAGGTAAMAVVAGVLVHARLLVYGASVAPRWRAQPRWFRALGPALLIDPTWALAERHAGMSAQDERRFLLGAALTLGTVWSATMAVGAVVGERLPHAGLGLAAPVCLVALVGPRLRERDHRWAAITGAIAAFVFTGGPAGIGMIVAIAAGCAAGELTRRWSR
jgi:predicted branched-subunit amino acid permease